jgi:hypothetical protein
MKKSTLTLLLFFIVMMSTFGQENNNQVLDRYFTGHSEIYFRFRIFDRNEIPVLTRIVSIDNVIGTDVFAYANRKEFGRFLDLGYSYTVLPHPGSLLKESDLNMGGLKGRKKSGTLWNFYPTYEQYVSYMQGFAADYPEICRLDTIGYTTNGRLLLAVKLSDSVNYSRSKPEFLYTSSIHGDETTGYILMMHLIDSLLTGYGNSARITNLLDNYQIYINPLANPDGTYAGGNNTVMGAMRYNANYLDLNRNFADPAAGSHPDGNAWQSETKAFMHYDTIHHFVMSANFHGGEEVMNYPWDTWSRLTADDPWFQFISREYVDTVHLYGPSGYFTFMNNGITNGYDWYTITGGRQDYTTYFHYGREITIEISNTKLMPANQLLNYWEYNRRSFLNYIEQCGYGINGQVTDTATGDPVRAKIFITGHDVDNSFQYSDAVSGWYFRPIAQGTWNLTFTCLGYHSKTIIGVGVTRRSTTRLNVQLVPLDFGIGDKNLAKGFTIFPNPSNGLVNFIPPEIGVEMSYRIFDMTGKTVKNGTLPTGSEASVNTLDLSDFPKGIYLMKIEAGRNLYSEKISLF